MLTCNNAATMRVVGNKHAKVMAAYSQGPSLPGRLQQLQQDSQDLEVFLFKLFYIFFPELQHTLGIRSGDS